MSNHIDLENMSSMEDLLKQSGNADINEDKIVNGRLAEKNDKGILLDIEQEKIKMKIQCPSCSSKLDVTELKPFTVFSCPRCGNEVTVPMRFQAYVLEEYLESSGGIHSYRALDEKLDREVCVVICEASDDHPWDQLERYLELVRKVASVSHSGLATIYSCGRYEAGVYVASQLLSKPVRDNVLAERLNWREAKDRPEDQGCSWP